MVYILRVSLIVFHYPFFEGVNNFEVWKGFVIMNVKEVWLYRTLIN